MYKTRLLVLFATVFIFPSLAFAIKARPPIQLVFQEQAISETEMEIILTAHANVDSSSVSLTLTLPPELSLIEGETEWEGPMSAGDHQPVRITILKPGTDGAVIEGEAQCKLPNSAVFEQYNRLVLKGGPKQGLKSMPPMQQKGNHESVLEFR